MTYLWLKALHTAAVLVWVGGLFTQSILLAALARIGMDPSSRSLITSVRRWDGRVTMPALLLVWALGIALGVLSGSFSKSWLSAKLVLVVVLSGLHGMQAGMLRRYSSNPDLRIPGFVRWFPGLIALSVLAIAILVVVKPG
ncbi:MAG: CopD family protein [Methylacidiphilaceae bacterium]|nr:CopD family protein [Candidatus Methylacidiphilaceae bacterium]